VEAPETVVARVERALRYVPAENFILAPDCGLKYLPREVAFGKLSDGRGEAAARKVSRVGEGQGEGSEA
jgi:methionine synthase II (cobalamin-independent)